MSDEKKKSHVEVITDDETQLLIEYTIKEKVARLDHNFRYILYSNWGFVKHRGVARLEPDDIIRFKPDDPAEEAFSIKLDEQLQL